MLESSQTMQITEMFSTTQEKMLKWAASHSMWPISFGFSCCASEIVQSTHNKAEIQKFCSSFKTEPQQSDLLIISGAITTKISSHVLAIYEQMLCPKYVVAVGNCALSGGLFHEAYSLIKIDKLLPIDIEISGCPPSSADIAQGIFNLQNQINRKIS